MRAGCADLPGTENEVPLGNIGDVALDGVDSGTLTFDPVATGACLTGMDST